MNSHKNTKYNKESFIKIAKETHLDNFEYENINYISYLKNKINILELDIKNLISILNI